MKITFEISIPSAVYINYSKGLAKCCTSQLKALKSFFFCKRRILDNEKFLVSSWLFSQESFRVHLAISVLAQVRSMNWNESPQVIPTHSTSVYIAERSPSMQTQLLLDDINSENVLQECAAIHKVYSSQDWSGSKTSPKIQCGSGVN